MTSRAETIQESRWRVQVRTFTGRVTHESSFRSGKKAHDYYNTLHIPGCHKRLEIRAAGEHRFKLLQTEFVNPCTCGGSMQGDNFVHASTCERATENEASS